MGDLVLGLAKTAVEGTLAKAKSAIDEEKKLKQSVQRDLVFITGEFQMMQCFLNTNDAEDSKNAVFKAWVRQLRDLAFDVEDCIEFVVHLDNKSAWWWRMVSLPSCMAPPLPLDVAVGDIKELKARVEEVSLRSTRYNLISDSGSKPAVEQQHPSIAGATEFDMLAEVRDAAKKQHGLWNLTDLISREGRDLQVISLWGTSSDLGMKSIIREAYKDLHICEAFPCRAWVKLVHPFNPHEFIRSLLAQFYAYSCQEQGSVIVVDVLKRMKAAAATDEDLMGEFMKQMSEQRYLVVLEDLSTMVDWDAARTCLPDMNNGSRIVVSTQQFEIASLCTGHPNRISEIRQFSADHSVCVLFKQGFQRDGDKWEDDVCRGVAPQPQGNFHGFKSEAAHIFGILKLVDSEIRGGKKSLAFKVMSVWGIDGVGKSALVRNIYHSQMLSKYSHRWGKYAWVHIPRPFSLTQFYRSLLWELRSMTSEDEHEEYSDTDDYYRHEIGVRCCNILREHRCLFIIDGLESVGQWVEIDETLKLRNAKGCTIVITNEERLARHCADDRSLVCNVKLSQQVLGDKSSCPSLTISPQSQGNFNLVCRRSEEAHILANFKRIDTEIRCAEEAIFNVISVWGIAGVGKSALVKSIYYDQMKVDYSHRWSKYGWVDVPHPFNLREFSRGLLLNILSSKYTDERANEHYRMSSTEDPIGECRDILREHRSLIVIDDLQSIEDWASISTALGIPSAKILTIVITNEESIAMHCAKYDYLVHNVRSLDPDAALHLFKYQAGALGSSLNHPDIVKQVKLVLNKCGGLPKVIIAMYRFVVFFEIMGLMEALRHLNANFMLELKKRADSDGIQGLLVWVHKYFRSCPDFLKPCVFYLPIFPPNYNIRRRRLLRRWIAEGYCRNSINATAEKNGETSFGKLVGLSMIQGPPHAINVENMSMTWCQINGFFREYIISQPMEDNMVFALEERCSQSSHYTGRHLVIQSSWDRDDRYVFQSIDFSRLRSLTVFGGWNPFFVSDKMKVLRVLDLENTSDISDDHVEQIVELLPRLKFLSLRGCTSVSRLPTSLGNLNQLETLDVRHTSITMLPPTIVNLQKLQYIRAGTTVQAQPKSKGSWLPKFCRKVIGAHLGVVAPKGIGKLEALDTLGVVNVGVSGGNAILKELKSLTQVRKLGVSGINRGNVKDLYSVIQALGHLESLSVRLDKDEQDFFCGVVDGISGPLKKNLKSLKLYGLLDMLPAWIIKLVNVCKLDLEMTMLSQEMIGYLSKMRRTTHICLCVKPVQDAEHNFSFRPHGPEGFLDLKVLEFDCSSRFVLTFESCIESIKLLKVHCNSGSQISGLAYLKNLERVWLVGSYEDSLKLDMERQLAEHPNKNKLVLQLKEVSSDVERDNEEVSSDVERNDGIIDLDGYFSDSDVRRREGIPDLEDESSDVERDNEE